MTKKNLVKIIIERLSKQYPLAECSLETQNPLELLIATRLSAQCTDARVNIVTPALFKRYPDAESFANADITELEALVKTCGLYKTKAHDIKAMCQKLIDDFDGQVPDSMDSLLSLPGVGRKTANLVLGEIFHQSAVITDTHCIRLSNRMGLCDSKNPLKVETALRRILPPGESTDFCHRLVHHGRAVCTARKPDCDACTLNDICVKAGV